MSETLFLALPLVAGEQAQKHVTVNEALATIDAIVQLSVKDRDLAAPPISPAEGDRYIVAPSPAGVWAGHANAIAAFRSGAWMFQTPREGWRCWVDDENAYLIFSGAAWLDWGAALGILQNLSRLGVGTTADATNPFSAKLNKALWAAKTTAEGGDGDLRTTLNKEAASDVLSILMQRGFSGRAEVGLIGDDHLTLKVSADGATWRSALVIDNATGKLTHLGQLQFPATQNPSTDPNCLDDYEEGAFTPTFSAATAPSGVTYASQSGKYTRIGNVVIFYASVGLSSKGAGGAGVIRLEGLPFTASGVSPILTAFWGNVDLPAGYTMLCGFVIAGTGRVEFYGAGDNVGAVGSDWAAATNTTQLTVSGSYFV